MEDKSPKAKAEADLRKRWIVGKLAALRVPDLSVLAEPAKMLTLREAAERWQASRVDVAESTTIQHRTALNRALPVLGDWRITRCPGREAAASAGARR